MQLISAGPLLNHSHRFYTAFALSNKALIGTLCRPQRRENRMLQQAWQCFTILACLNCHNHELLVIF